MNIETTEIPLSVKEGVDTIDNADLKDFFESLRQQEYVKLRATVGIMELTSLQARVTLLDELEDFLSTIQKTKFKS